MACHRRDAFISNFNFNSEISISLPRHPYPQSQRFRARANDSSGHAVWPAMRAGKNISAHAKTLHFSRIAPQPSTSDNVLFFRHPWPFPFLRPPLPLFCSLDASPPLRGPAFAPLTRIFPRVSRSQDSLQNPSSESHNLQSADAWPLCTPFAPPVRNYQS
jgi:hypothetical protein